MAVVPQYQPISVASTWVNRGPRAQHQRVRLYLTGISANVDTIHQATAETRSGLKPEMENTHQPRNKPI